MNIFENMDPKTYLELNAKLQQKKRAVRTELAGRGILKRDGTNNFDHYSYFSEAQYKALFTELFSTHGLELRFNEIEYGTFEGSEKQANGRMPRLEFSLIDCDTGFYESTTITGEGMDKGDKAGYKAYTGALKYYLANTFMVATGDDPEKDSPDNRMNRRASRASYQPQPATELKPRASTGSAVVCANCGQTIDAYVSKKTGKNVTPLDHASACYSAFGRVLCPDCIEKEGAR